MRSFPTTSTADIGPQHRMLRRLPAAASTTRPPVPTALPRSRALPGPVAHVSNPWRARIPAIGVDASLGGLRITDDGWIHVPSDPNESVGIVVRVRSS